MIKCDYIINCLKISHDEGLDLLTFDDAQKFLNTKKSHLRSLIYKKRIPYFKVGEHIRFDKNVLDWWLLKNAEGVLK